MAVELLAVEVAEEPAPSAVAFETNPTLAPLPIATPLLPLVTVPYPIAIGAVILKAVLALVPITTALLLFAVAPLPTAKAAEILYAVVAFLPMANELGPLELAPLPME